jgi:MoaA/NifB/PqqE/SkfB family radical SAM enzyme
MIKPQYKHVDIKLGYKCNNNCLHCVISDQKKNAYSHRKNTDRTTKECIDEIKSAKNQGCTIITLTGGEPTIRKDFLEIARYAKDLGFRIHLQSNGRLFLNENLSKESSQLIDLFMIALHSSNEQTHDKITQKENSFNQTLNGIKNLLKNNAKIGIKIVLSKYNYKELKQILEFTNSLKIPYVNVAFPHANGNAYKYFDEIVPTYKEIMPYVEDAIQYAQNTNLQLELEQILPCALSKTYPLKYFSDLKIKRSQAILKQLDQPDLNWREVSKTSKRKFSICQRCIYNTFCEGYWKEYIEKIGHKEFSPQTTLTQEVKEIFKQNLKSWK